MVAGSAWGTLLGPEGTTVSSVGGPAVPGPVGRGAGPAGSGGCCFGCARCGLASHTGFRVVVGGRRVGRGVGWWVVGWLLVEICIVDASIFIFCFVWLSW